MSVSIGARAETVYIPFIIFAQNNWIATKKPGVRRFLTGHLVFCSVGAVLRVSLCREAIAAIDRTLGFGLEGHFRLLAAVGTGSSKVLTGAAGGRFAAITAGLAALRLILKAALGVEFLLTGGEREILIAFLTLHRSVFVHAPSSSLLIDFYIALSRG